MNDPVPGGQASIPAHVFFTAGNKRSHSIEVSWNETVSKKTRSIAAEPCLWGEEGEGLFCIIRVIWPMNCGLAGVVVSDLDRIHY